MTETFDKHMEKVAKHIADKAVHKDTIFAESLDAFKQLTAYYGLLLKNKDAPDPDADGATFGDFGRRMNEAEEPINGRSRSKVPGRTGDG